MPTLPFPRSLPQALSQAQPRGLPLAPPVARVGLATTAALLAIPDQRWLDVEGRRFVLRAPGAGDAALLGGGLWNDDLSSAARRMRFHAGVGRIGLDRLQACCQLTPARGQALVLTQLLTLGATTLLHEAYLDITSLDTELAEQCAWPELLSAVSEALDELAQVDPLLAQVVDLKFFCGLSMVEIAALMNTSERTAQRQWEKARLLLFRSVQSG